MARKMRYEILAQLTDVTRDFWKIGTIPYNTFVILLTTAIMIESQAWKLRELEA